MPPPNENQSTCANVKQNMPKTTLNNLGIIKAKTKDFNKIFKLLKQLWPKKNLKQEKLFSRYKNEIKSKSKLYYLINLKKKTAGFYSLRSVEQTAGLYIDELVIDTQSRNIGIGTKAIKNIFSYAKKNRYKKIQLHSNFHREKTHKFYQKLGFEKSISLTSSLRRAYIFTKVI